MSHVAKGAKLPPHGWAGSLHHDETKVQKDNVFQMAPQHWLAELILERKEVKIIWEKRVQQTNHSGFAADISRIYWIQVSHLYWYFFGYKTIFFPFPKQSQIPKAV